MSKPDYEEIEDKDCNEEEGGLPFLLILLICSLLLYVGFHVADIFPPLFRGDFETLVDNVSTDLKQHYDIFLKKVLDK